MDGEEGGDAHTPDEASSLARHTLSPPAVPGRSRTCKLPQTKVLGRNPKSRTVEQPLAGRPAAVGLCGTPDLVRSTVGCYEEQQLVASALHVTNLVLQLVIDAPRLSDLVVREVVMTAFCALHLRWISRPRRIAP